MKWAQEISLSGFGVFGALTLIMVIYRQLIAKAEERFDDHLQRLKGGK